MKKSICIFLAIFVVVSLACNMPGTDAQPTAPADPGAQPAAPVEGQPAAPADSGAQPAAPVEGQPAAPVEEGQPAAPVEAPTATPEPTPIPSEPVSIRRGLASLNSYTFLWVLSAKGPEPETVSYFRTEMSASQENDASLTTIETTESTVEDPELTSSTQYIYNIGLDQCVGEGEDWEFSSMTPEEKELMDVMSDMIDILPLIDDPVYVGSESVNGVMTDHFSFTVSGIGVTSGALVSINQGEYWLAQDGQYLVKYSLRLELSTSPEEVSSLEVYMELTNINQPVEISFPAVCQP